MDIDVNDLDLGYTQCSELHTLVDSSGKELLSSLASNITSLKTNWIGSDATVHINRLIEIYNALYALVSDAENVTSSAASRIIAIQELRSANGGGGFIGEPLTNSVPEKIEIPKCEDTVAYHVNPGAKADYDNLVSESTTFSAFVSSFIAKKEELLGNWTAGSDRETAVTSFGKFEENTEDYKKYLEAAQTDLGTAVENIEKIG